MAAYPVSRISSAPAVVNQLNWYAEKTLIHCGAALKSLTRAEDRVRDLDIYPNDSTDVADREIREAKTQRKAMVKAGSYFQTIRVFDQRMKEDKGGDELKNILLKLSSFPPTSRVWLYARPLQKAVQKVNIEKVGFDSVLVTNRHRLSAAIKDALKEASFLQTIAKMGRSAEKRETFYKNEASARKQESESLKTTVKAVSGELKRAKAESLAVQTTLKKARTCAQNVI